MLHLRAAGRIIEFVITDGQSLFIVAPLQRNSYVGIALQSDRTYEIEFAQKSAKSLSFSHSTGTP
jgi:hypothetical protein